MRVTFRFHIQLNGVILISLAPCPGHSVVSFNIYANHPLLIVESTLAQLSSHPFIVSYSRTVHHSFDK